MDVCALLPDLHKSIRTSRIKILMYRDMKFSSLIIGSAMLSMGTLCAAAAENSKFIRTMVVEEHTGTWCMWCPRGYVGMEYMREKYGSSNYIGIAIHVSGSTADPMQSTTYAAYMQKYQDGFPNSLINRLTYCDPQASKLESAYLNQADQLSPAAISITADASAGESAETEVVVEMRNDTPYHSYGIAWVVTEDNVGPYSQKNGYAGGSTPMGGFEDMSSRPSIMFNDVARRIVDWKGNRNVLPSAMEAGKQYTVNRTVSLKEVANVENAHIIALLLDTSTGEIINGAKVSLSTNSSVANVARSAAVEVHGNSVTLSADRQATAVYTLTGTRAASLQPGQTVTLPAGFYLVGGTKIVINH